MSGPSVVELEMALWHELYPAFATATDLQLTLWWEQINALIDNSPTSPVPYSPPSQTTRKAIMYAALCHMAELAGRGNGAVGRVVNSAEGSVNAALAYDDKSGPAWWVQTQCGALAWQMLKPYRAGGLYFGGGCKY